MKNKTITISAEIANKLKDLKTAGVGGLTYNELLEFLLNSMGNKLKFQKGINKAETMLLEWLNFGHPLKIAANSKIKITAAKIRELTNIDYNYTKKLMEAYTTEIAEFNNQFKN